MRIGIDIDDTINMMSKTLLQAAIEYNKEKNIVHDIQAHEWNFDKSFGWNEEHEVDFISNHSKKALMGAEPKERAQELIAKLKEEGHTIIIITARHEDEVKDAYGISAEWLQMHNIPYDKLVVNSRDKAEKCKENNIDVFVDDHVRHCENVYDTLKIPVYIFDSIYNQEFKHENIKRVYSWEEIYNNIQEMIKK